MSTGKWKPGLIIGTAIVVLTFLFLKTKAADAEKYHEVVLEIQRLSYQDSLVNESILKLQTDLFANYDLLASQNKKIKNHLKRLKKLYPELHGQHIADFGKAINHAKEQLESKLLLTERFKSHNGVLKNSLYYMPTAVENSLQKADNKIFYSDLSHLLRTILLFNTRPTDQYRDQATMFIEKIKKSEQPDLQEIALHAANIIKQRLKLLTITDSLFAVPVKQSVDNIYHSYSSHYATKVKWATRYRIALYVMGLILVMYMLHLFLSLRRTMRSLENTLGEVAFQKNAIDESAIVVSVNSEGVIDYVNEKFCQISQFTTNEIIGQPCDVLMDGFHGVDDISEIWAQCARGESWTGELNKQKRDGTHYWVEAKIVPFLDKEKVPVKYVALLTDITDRKLVEEKNYHLAHYDNLTQLPNRALYVSTIENSLTNAIESESKVAILFIDLDNFKQINDTMGHAAGDELLKIVASHLSFCVKDSDIVSRLGGDEFTIGLFDLKSIYDVEAIVDSIMSITKLPVLLDKKKVAVSFSIGVSMFPDHANDVSALLKTADIAMYNAKFEGKNRCVYFKDAMTQNDLNRHAS